MKVLNIIGVLRKASTYLTEWLTVVSNELKRSYHG